VREDKVDFRQLVRCLLKGKAYIFAGIVSAVLWIIFFYVVSIEKKCIYQKEMSYSVTINEEVCPLRKADIERCIYGESGKLNRKWKTNCPGLPRGVILIVTWPWESGKQIEKFKIFVRTGIRLKTESKSEEIQKKLYNGLKQRVLFSLTKRVESLKQDISVSKDVRNSGHMTSRKIKLEEYKRLISEGKTPVLEKITQTEPEIIWQKPNMFLELPTAVLIGLTAGIIMAVACGKKNEGIK